MEIIMTRYKLCERYKDGISFIDINKDSRSCADSLYRAAYEVLIQGHTKKTRFKIDEVIEIAATQGDIDWLVDNHYVEIKIIEKIYHIGQMFERSHSKGNLWILAQCGNNLVSLIALHDGNRFMELVQVEHPDRITETEFGRICGGHHDEFAEVRNKLI